MAIPSQNLILRLSKIGKIIIRKNKAMQKFSGIWYYSCVNYMYMVGFLIYNNPDSKFMPSLIHKVCLLCEFRHVIIKVCVQMFVMEGFYASYSCIMMREQQGIHVHEYTCSVYCIKSCLHVHVHVCTFCKCS